MSKFPVIGHIRTERLKKNLALEDLAQMYGCTKQGMQDIETREIQGRVSINTMHKIAKALGKKFEYRFV